MPIDAHATVASLLNFSLSMEYLLLVILVVTTGTLALASVCGALAGMLYVMERTVPLARRLHVPAPRRRS
jgi:hypothetical protein